jgi:hypothetical protein
MQQLPFYVYLVFGATVFIAATFLFIATRFSWKFMTMLLVWIGVQSILSIQGFYNNQATMTTRFPLLFIPALAYLVFQFTTAKGKAFISNLDLRVLTIIQIIRIPVELVLFWLFINKTIPAAMTFHGRNFDIFSGITAPFVYYYGFVKKKIGKNGMVVWNFICLGLLVNVVATALLSLPARFQQFGFEQPNLALGFFPFILLPAFLVPAVLFSMLVSIRQLLRCG